MKDNILTNKSVPSARWYRIIPPMILVYIVAYMDRMNIAFAMAGGMNEDLGLTATVAGLAAGIFFGGYVVLQMKGGHVAEHGSAKKFILFSILGWGGLSVITGFVQNEWQLFVLRFLLGVAEGGVWPAILVSIGNWFPANETGRANAFFMTSLAIAAVITNPLSGWIVETYNWRYIFFIEGGISLVLIFIWWPMFSDRPKDAKWISSEEKNYLEETLQKEREAVSKVTRDDVSYRQLLKNPNLWKMSIIYLCNQVGQNGFLIWLPTILKDMTKMGMTSVGLLSAVPYVIALAGLYLFPVLADKTMKLKRYTSLSMFGFGASLFLSAYFKDFIWVAYAFIILTGFFTKAPAAVFWTMPRILFQPGVSGAARGFINAVGNVGGFIGPFAVGLVSTQYGVMAGVFTLAGFLITGSIVTLTLPKTTDGETDNSVMMHSNH